jgi:protein-tyrosine phosphatase
MASDPVPGRRIELEGSFNFRDLGGYHGVDGRPVRWRSLFRADGLYRLTPADLERLGGLGLRTVVDLRTAGELEARGRIAWPTDDLVFHHLPLMDVLPPDDEYPEWSDPAHVATQYAGMLADGAPAVAAAIDVLCDPAAYPVVFHCMAGKDRTGILSALVLALLGVTDDDIVGDYALSGEAMQRLLAWLRATQPERAAEVEKGAAAVVAAEPASMAQFLSDFRHEHGSAEAYVASLGLDGVGDRLREQLLVEA